jgi:hypothetical protein
MVDFEAPHLNDWLADNQFTVVEGQSATGVRMSSSSSTACRWPSSN